MWDGLRGERRVELRCFGSALFLALAIVALIPGSAAAQGPVDPYEPTPPPSPPPSAEPERSLALTLPAKLEVASRARVRISGTAFPGDELTVFVDPEGRACPTSAEARPQRAIPLISEADFDGPFEIGAAFTPKRAGKRTFCAYLGAASGQKILQAGRKVFERRLQESTALRTIAIALRRHGFAKRVVKSLDRECRRRARSVFTCTFSGGFPGYRLTGKGRVRLGVDLSYRFPVKAQGVRLTLTDDNEDPRLK